MTVPREALSGVQAAVLAAVLRQRRPTTRSVADECGLSVSYVHHRLIELRDLGLVTWEPGLAGTLRASCYVVPLGAVDRPFIPRWAWSDKTT